MQGGWGLKSDSLRVVSQRNGEFECKEASMSKYMQLIQEKVKTLKRFVIDQVPRTENHKADALSKLASSAEGDAPRTVFGKLNERKALIRNKPVSQPGASLDGPHY